MTTNSKDRMDHITIIADNGGGLTLQIDDGKRRWQHTYTSGEPGRFDGCDIVADIINYVDEGDLDSFEGDETDEYGWAEPTHEDERNGGYRVLSLADVIDYPAEEGAGWINLQELGQRLRDAVVQDVDADELLAAAVQAYVERN